MRARPEIERNPWIGVILCLLVFSTALRPAEKYAGSWLVWLPYVALVFLGVTLAFTDRGQFLIRLVANRWWQAGLLAVVSGLSIGFYPLADGLKTQMQGQDQDDCTVLGVQGLLSFANPVSEPTYFGNPCSNLIGAIAPHIPFVLLNNMGLAGPVFLTMTLYFLLRTGSSSAQTGLFLSALVALPATLELMVNGSDFVFIGLSILVVVRILELWRDGHLEGRLWPWILAILVALVGTTRINMLLFIIVIGIVLLAMKKSIVPLIVASSTAIAPNVYWLLSDPSAFAPLHLIGKGQTLVPGALYLAMFGVTALFLLFGLIQRNWVKANLGLYIILSFGAHLIFLSTGDLVFNREFDLFWWEGANYLFLITPLIIWFATNIGLGSKLTRRVTGDD